MNPRAAGQKTSSPSRIFLENCRPERNFRSDFTEVSREFRRNFHGDRGSFAGISTKLPWFSRKFLWKFPLFRGSFHGNFHGFVEVSTLSWKLLWSLWKLPWSHGNFDETSMLSRKLPWKLPRFRGNFHGNFHGFAEISMETSMVSRKSRGNFDETSMVLAGVSREFRRNFHGARGSFAGISTKLPRCLREFRGNFDETSTVLAGVSREFQRNLYGFPRISRRN